MTSHMPTPYERIGGAERLRELVDRFYDLMDTIPEAYAVRRLHPANLEQSRDKLYKFLSGWLGGPPLYVQEFGHPRLRARHMPFPIGIQERDEWLHCMEQAMDELDLPRDLRFQLQQAFAKTADFMRNQPAG